MTRAKHSNGPPPPLEEEQPRIRNAGPSLKRSAGQAGFADTTKSNGGEGLPRALVPAYHGFEEASREIVKDALFEALLPLCPSLDVLRAFAGHETSIYLSAVERISSIMEGRERPPSGKLPPLKRAKWGRGYRRCLDDISKRVAEDAIVIALAPLVTTVELIDAADYDECLIIDVTRRIECRIRQAKEGGCDV